MFALKKLCAFNQKQLKKTQRYHQCVCYRILIMFNNLYHDFSYKKFFLFKFEDYTYLFYLSMLIQNICKF